MSDNGLEKRLKVEGLNPLSGIHSAVERSWRDLKKARDSRLALLQEYQGRYPLTLYERAGATTNDDRRPLNMIQMIVDTYLRSLAPAVPRVLVRVKREEFKGFALDAEFAMNHLARELELEAPFRAALLDAMVSKGVVKVGVDEDSGQPFVDHVPFDRWVHDTTAERWADARFWGNRYLMNLAEAQERKDFDATNRKLLRAQSQAAEPNDSVSRNRVFPANEAPNSHREDDFDPVVELWDLYLPRQKQLVTVDTGNFRLLRVQDWHGAKGGPFITVSYATVPDTIMPVVPAYAWYDLHLLVNVLMNKTSRQAADQASVYPFTGDDEDEINLLRKAKDGEVVRVSPGTTAWEPLKKGGVDQASMAMLAMAKSELSYIAGNLDLLSGVSPQSRTIGQDKMLLESASKRLADMQESAHKFMRHVMKDLAHYLWADPKIDIPLIKRIPGVDVDIPFRFDAKAVAKHGEFIDYEFDIDLYSLIDQSPSGRLQSIIALVNNAILPVIPVAQQLGPDFLPRYAALMARYNNTAEIAELFGVQQDTENPYEAPDAIKNKLAKPANTTRTYERVNVQGRSERGQTQVMMQALMGGQPQQSEMGGQPQQ